MQDVPKVTATNPTPDGGPSIGTVSHDSLPVESNRNAMTPLPVTTEKQTPALREKSGEPEHMNRIHIVLDEECKEKLRKACEENERTSSAQIRFLIRRHL